MCSQGPNGYLGEGQSFHSVKNNYMLVGQHVVLYHPKNGNLLVLLEHIVCNQPSTGQLLNQKTGIQGREKRIPPESKQKRELPTQGKGYAQYDRIVLCPRESDRWWGRTSELLEQCMQTSHRRQHKPKHGTGDGFGLAGANPIHALALFLWHHIVFLPFFQFHLHLLTLQFIHFSFWLPVLHMVSIPHAYHMHDKHAPPCLGPSWGHMCNFSQIISVWSSLLPAWHALKCNSLASTLEVLIQWIWARSQE